MPTYRLKIDGTHTIRISGKADLVIDTDLVLEPFTSIPKLAAPVLSALQLSASSLGTSWTDVPGASNYRLDRALDAAFTQGVALVFTGGSTSFTDSNLLADTLYYYRVKALGDATRVDSEFSTPPASARTKAAVIPIAPGDMGGIPQLNIIGSDWANLNRDTKQNISYVFSNGNGSTYLAGNLPSGNGQVKGAGNYTWTAPKKPFNLYLAAASMELGLVSGKTRRSLAEYNDPTLLRNYAAFNLMRRFGMLAPETRPVEVSLDGVYYGLDTYTTKPDKLVASVVGKRAFVFQKVLTSQEGDLTKVNYFETPYYGTNNYVGPKYAGERHGILLENPEFGSATAEEFTNAQAVFAHFETTLGYAYSDKVNGPLSIVDENSFCGNFLVQEFFKNPDGESASSYIYQGTDGKLYFIAWDFDQGAPTYYGATDTSFKGSWIPATPHYAKAFANGFEKGVEAYYQANRPAFVAMIDDVRQKAQLFTSTGVAERNNTKWDIYNQDGNKLPNGTVLPTHPQHVTLLLDWFTGRLADFDIKYGAPTYGYIDYLTFTDGETNRIAVPTLIGIRTVRLWLKTAYRDDTQRSILLLMDQVAQIRFTAFGAITGGTVRVNGKEYDESVGLDGLITGEWTNVVLELPQAATAKTGLWTYFAGKQGRLEFYAGTLSDAQCTAERVITEATPLALYNSRVSGKLLLDESGNDKHAILYGTLPISTRPPVLAPRSPKPTTGMDFNVSKSYQTFTLYMEPDTYHMVPWMKRDGKGNYWVDFRDQDGNGTYYFANESSQPGANLYFNQTAYDWNFLNLPANGDFVRVFMRNIVVTKAGYYTFLQRFTGGDGMGVVLNDLRIFKGGAFTDAELADSESAPTDNLYAHYAMDGPATGNGVLPDISGNGHDATLSGF